MIYNYLNRRENCAEVIKLGMSKSDFYLEDFCKFIYTDRDRVTAGTPAGHFYLEFLST